MRTATDRLEFAPPPTPGLMRSLGLAVLATLALWRLKWSVMRVIGVCALAGLLLRWPGPG